MGYRCLQYACTNKQGSLLRKTAYGDSPSTQ